MGTAALAGTFGAARPTITVIGGHGDPPALGSHDKNGNLPFQTDFRQVYASVLEGWLKVPADIVIARGFKTLPLLQSA